MIYKNLPSGEIFRLWQISQTRICLKLQTGEAADLSSGEIIHIHPTKKVDPVDCFPSGTIGSVKDRPCFVSPHSYGRVICEYFVIISSTIEPEQLVIYPTRQAKQGTTSKEVHIILSSAIVMLRKIHKLLRGQADTLESLCEGDIIPDPENFMPSDDKKLDSA